MQFHCIVHNCIQQITNQPKKITCNICHQVGVILEKFFSSLHTLNTNIYINIHKPIKEQMCQKLKGVHSKQQLVHMYLPLHWPPSQKKRKKKKQNSGQSLLYQQQTQLIKSKSPWSSGGCIFGKLHSHVLPKNSRPLFPSCNNLLWIHVIIIHGRQRKFWFNLMTNFSCNRYFILFASNGQRTLVL